MTVQELINKLEKQDKNLPVVLLDYDNDVREIYEVVKDKRYDTDIDVIILGY